MTATCGRHRRWAEWLASAITLGAAALVLGLGILHNTFAAADTDPFGYVSAADLLARGSLSVDQPFARSMPWPQAEATFAPAGYRSRGDGTIVPAYPLGLPLVMAAFQLVGGRMGVFYVVPILGALAVWASGRLGARLHSPLAGALTALLLATSPSFLYQVVQPVSDVPATAWWVVSLTLALCGGGARALAAGLAASAAILTRPNLVPLAAVIGLFLLWRALGVQAEARRVALRALGLFVLGVVPGCLIVAVLNQYLYGSPLRSGYGGLSMLYSWRNVLPNLVRYPRWLMETQTPLIYLGLLAPWFAGRGRSAAAAPPRLRLEHVWLLLGFAWTVVVSYLFYLPWGREEWVYLRFILPAYPALIALSVAVGLEGLRRLTPGRLARAAAITAVGALSAWQAREAVDRGALVVRVAEQRYVDVGQHVAARMPQNALFIAGIHSGSIRYYSNRITLRYDLLPPGWLDDAVEVLGEKGYRPYIVLEEAEEPGFRAQFADRNTLGQLDWPPVLHRTDPVRVRIYDPADRARFFGGEGVFTEEMGLTRRHILSMYRDGTVSVWPRPAAPPPSK